MLIRGAPLLGFHGVFDGDYGSPSTPRPYPRVKPARVGGKLLPFRCPHCDKPAPEHVGARARDYLDPVRGHSYCVGCRGRFVIDRRGRTVVGQIDVGDSGDVEAESSDDDTEAAKKRKEKREALRKNAETMLAAAGVILEGLGLLL